MENSIKSCESYASELIAIYSNDDEERIFFLEAEFLNNIIEIEPYYKAESPFEMSFAGRSFKGDPANLELYRVEVYLGPACRIVWEDGFAWMEAMNVNSVVDFPWTRVSCNDEFTSCVERLFRLK
jgi:hypothetical protein